MNRLGMTLERNNLVCIVLAVLLALIGLGSVSAQESFSSQGKLLSEECEKAIATKNYDLLTAKAKELSRLGNSEANEEEVTTGDALLLHALIAVRDTTDFTPMVESLIKKAPALEQSSPKVFSVVTRSLASYYQRIVHDYSQALMYASQTLSAARSLGDKNAEAAALSVLASIYFQKQDPTGWSYALDSYNLAKEQGDIDTKYVASCNLANYLYNKSEYDEALRYLLEAKEYAHKAKLDSEDSYLDSFLGDIYWRLGKLEESEKCYKESLDTSPATSNYDKVYSRICYAIFLVETKRLQEALNLLFDTKKMAQKYKVTIFDKQIYSWISRVYEELDDYPKALDFYKKYTAATLTDISEQKEREFAILDLRNRVTEEERKNASQALEIAKRGKTIVILISVGTLFLLLCVGGFVYYKRKVKGYEEVVKRYLENVKSEQLLREQLEAALQSRQEQKPSGLDEEKRTEMYLRLEKMMRDDKIYRDSSLSLGSAAEMLSTNRTYLSQVVNEKSGKSFSNYVNEHRLNEAVELLSDSSSEESLKEICTKVGFTSPSNFYTLFKQRVGVSPSVFRENVKNIKKDIQD